MKTSELTGAALDWAVCVAEYGYGADYKTNKYSTDWAQGGSIIERERITLASPNPIDAEWCAMLWATQAKQSGPTPLIAAMRCYVASKLGDEVAIPSELTQGEMK